MLDISYTGDPVLSPRGNEAVFVVTKMNTELNDYESSLYLSNLKGDIKRLTNATLSEKLVSDKDPIWSPDGKTIYFLSNRHEKTQVWKISTTGGEAIELTNYDNGVSQFVVSPDNTQLGCTVKVDHHDQEDHDVNEDVVIVERLRYIGNGKGFLHGRTHIFLYNLQDNSTIKLTNEEDIDTHSPVFSNNNEFLFYQKSRSSPEKNGYFNNIYRYNLITKTDELIYIGKGYSHNITVSPNDKYIAFVGHESGEVSTENSGVWILPVNGGSTQNLTESYDRPVGNFVGTDASYDAGGQIIQWRDDSHSLSFLATEGGNCVLKQVTLEGIVSDYHVEEQCVITSYTEDAGTLVINKATPLSTGNLYLVKNDLLKQLTYLNDTLFNELEIGMPRKFTFNSVDNWKVEGWILLPPNIYQSNKKIPVVLEVHGGPHTAYGNAFHHEFQCLAAEGYAVVYTNPRGSQGYGKTFTEACRGDWGGKDKEDILNGLDYILENYPQCDADQLFVTGGSYGGFMTNMIISNTNRFKAAVTQRCISNMYSFFGTSDIGYFFGEEQLGQVDLWEDEETIMRFSPIRYAKNVNTPTCIIHSEDDLRCPIEQAEQWYVALRRLGVDTRFVRFKGENHELSRSGKPKNRITRLEEILNWFNQKRSQLV